MEYRIPIRRQQSIWISPDKLEYCGMNDFFTSITTIYIKSNINNEKALINADWTPRVIFEFADLTHSPMKRIVEHIINNAIHIQHISFNFNETELKFTDIKHMIKLIKNTPILTLEIHYEETQYTGCRYFKKLLRKAINIPLEERNPFINSTCKSANKR